MKKRSYFLSGTTAKGFVNFYDDLTSRIDFVLYIDGGFTTILHPTFEYIIQKYENKYEIECVYNHLEPDQLEALIIPELNVAIIDRTKMMNTKIYYPNLKEYVLYIGESYNNDHLKKYEVNLKQLRSEINSLYQQTIHHFKTALNHHHDVENTYRPYLNIHKANQETDRLINEFFQNSHLNKPSQVVQRYLGAATSNGPIDFVMELTDDVDRRVFIKGRSGTGKSTILNKIADEAKNRGFDAEIYYCGFDPDSLDMVILRELGIAIFDATAPHEHEPKRSNDEIFDPYELFVDGDPDHEKADTIKKLKDLYKQEMKQATKVLKEIRDKQREYETIYKYSIDESYIDEVTNKVTRWLARFI